jgi:hypothetical protein
LLKEVFRIQRLSVLVVQATRRAVELAQTVQVQVLRKLLQLVVVVAEHSEFLVHQTLVLLVVAVVAVVKI